MDFTNTDSSQPNRGIRPPPSLLPSVQLSSISGSNLQQRQQPSLNIGLTSPVQRVPHQRFQDELSGSLGNVPQASNFTNRGTRGQVAMRNTSVSMTPPMHSATTAMSGSTSSFMNGSSTTDREGYLASRRDDNNGAALPPSKYVSVMAKQRQVVVRSALFLCMLFLLIIVSTLRRGNGESQSAMKAAGDSGSSRSSNSQQQKGEWWDEAPISPQNEPIDRWSYKRAKDLEKENNNVLLSQSLSPAQDSESKNSDDHKSPSPTTSNIISDGQAAQLKRFMLQKNMEAGPWRDRHWRDYEVYRPIGFGNADDDLRGARMGSGSNRQHKACKRRLPWKKVFIATNLFNNEDMIADYLASLTTFIERGLLGRQRSKLDAHQDDPAAEGEPLHEGDWFKPEDIFVSVYSNANADSTPYLLEHMMHPMLNKIGIRHHIVPQGAPSCSALRSGNKDTASGISTLFPPSEVEVGNSAKQTNKYSMRYYDRTRKKPKSLSRIEWLGCLRNHALLPLFIHGREGLFGTQAARDTTTPRAPVNNHASYFGGFHSPSELHPAFLKWSERQRQLEQAKKKLDPQQVDEGKIPYLSNTASLVDYDAFIHEWFRDTYRVPESQKFRQRWHGGDKATPIEEEQGTSATHADPIAKCNHSFGLTGYFQQPYQNWWDPHSLNFKQTRQRYENVVKNKRASQYCAGSELHTNRKIQEVIRGDERREDSTSESHPEEFISSEDNDDDVLVLFFNDVYFYPWQLSYLIATNTGIDVPLHSPEKGHDQAQPSFDMACALDYYYNLYDTWVLRGLDGQPFTPYAPYAPLEPAMSPLTDIRPILAWQRGQGQGGGETKHKSPPHKATEALIAPTLISDVLGYNGYYQQLKDVKVEADTEVARRKVQAVLRGLTEVMEPETGHRQIVLPSVPVRSCWNGVVAIRGGLFLRQGLRFRYQTKEELLYQQCWESECKFIGQDMATIAMLNFMQGEDKNSGEQSIPHPQKNNLATQKNLAAEPFVLAPARIVVNPLVQLSYTKDFFGLYQGEEASTVVVEQEEFVNSVDRSDAGAFWWEKSFVFDATSEELPKNESFAFEGDTFDVERGTFTYTIHSYIPVSSRISWWNRSIYRLLTHVISSGFAYSLFHWVKLETWWPFVAVPPHPPTATDSKQPDDDSNRPPPQIHEKMQRRGETTGPFSGNTPSKSALEILSLVLQVARKLESSTRPASVEELLIVQNIKTDDVEGSLESHVLPSIPPELQKFVVLGDRRVIGGRLRPPKDPEDDELKPFISDEDELLYQTMFGVASQAKFIGSWWWHHFEQIKAFQKVNPKVAQKQSDEIINYASLINRFEGIGKAYFFLAIRILLTLKDPNGYDLEVLLSDSLGVTSPPPRAHQILLRALKGSSPLASILDPRFMFCVDATDTFSLSGGSVALDVLCFGLFIGLVILVRRHLLEHHHPQHFIASTKLALHQLQDAAMHPSHLFQGGALRTASTTGAMTPSFASDAEIGCTSLRPYSVRAIAMAIYRAIKELFVALPVEMFVRPLALRLNVGGSSLISVLCCGGKWLEALVRGGSGAKDSAKMV